MRELDFTLEDVGDPMVFTLRATRLRLSRMQAELGLILALLGVLERTRPASRIALARARRAVEAARRQLLGVGDDMERALMRRRDVFGGYYGRSRPIEFALEALEKQGDPVRSTLKAIRERMTRVQAELGMLLVLLLVFGRIRQNVARRRLARAKRAIRDTRRELVEARAQVDRAFAGESDPTGGVEFAGQTS